MKFTPYLNFKGDCKEAFEFYAKTFGGTIDAMMPFEGTPAAEHVPPDQQSQIMHACLSVGDQTLMASDCFGGMYQKPSGMSVSIHFDTADEGRRVFDALAQGGEIVMPFEPTFWSSGFGMVTDRFGTPWMINCQPAG